MTILHEVQLLPRSQQNLNEIYSLGRIYSLKMNAIASDVFQTLLHSSQPNISPSFETLTLRHNRKLKQTF